MANTNREIQIGSIIHLQNGAPGGGYLETHGRVQDKPVITKWQDPRIRSLVMTHEIPNRDTGSGSWRVLSAAGKATGKPLAVGDKIHLLNMYPGAGYLDSFEWVPNLEPFKDFPMTIGVFTADTPTRGGGPSGTWIARSAAGKPDGEPVSDGDAIYLENAYPGAGFLHSWAKDKVTDHPLFKEYTGNQKFVFTAVVPQPDYGSRHWTIVLRRVYRVQYQWRDKSSPWHDGGIFRLNSRIQQPVVALQFTSDDGGRTLTGTVTYAGEKKRRFQAEQAQPNIYNVQTQPAGAAWQPAGKWRIDSRQEQNIVELNAASEDGGQALRGELRYQGEGPIRFRAIRENEDTSSQTDALLKGRSDKIEGVMETTYQLLAGVFDQISGDSLDAAAQKLKELKTGESSPTAVLPQPAAKQTDDVDRAFQLAQLLNLYTLSQKLNHFFRQTLQTLVQETTARSQQTAARPPLHLIRETFRRVAADHEIIQQAAIQRRWNKHLDGRFYMSEQAIELLVMDKLAWKAIAPFQHLLAGDGEQMAVITYLSERTHIRHAPYAPNFVLVGLSYDRVPPASSLFGDTDAASYAFPSAELMAIPHEIGHHIYQHGRLPNGKTFAQISDQFRDNPYYAWCEEIFADLYGCTVAGPLSALGMQALLVSLDRRRFWKDDEEHPTPLLRVFLMAEMLRVLGEIEARQAGTDSRSKRYRFAKITATLDANWAGILQKWQYERLDEGNGRPRRLYLPDPAASQLDKIVNVERVVQTVHPIILEFAEILLNEAQFDQPVAGNDALPLDIPWSVDNDNIAHYTEQMRGLRTRQFANKKLTIQQLKWDEEETAVPPNDEPSPEKRLRHILDEWSDSGPTGSSGGTRG